MIIIMVMMVMWLDSWNMNLSRIRNSLLYHPKSDIHNSLKSQVVSLQTAHSWANAGVLLGDGSGVAFEAIKLLG